MAVFEVARVEGSRGMTTSDVDGASPASGRAGEAAASILVFMPQPATGRGVSYSCMSILRNLGTFLDINVFTPYGSKGANDPFLLNQTFPLALRLLPAQKLRGLAFRVNRKFATHRTEQRLLTAAKEAVSTGRPALAYIWPDASVQLLRRLRDAGVPVVREMINCHRGVAKRILDAEYKRLGLEPRHSISAESVDREIEALESCDYVFCSNERAEQSVVDFGVPQSKVRPVSFGWEPARFKGDARALAPIDGPTFLFVGLACIRKGAHLILRYWAASGIRGRLVFVGNVEPAIKEVCAEYLRRDDVLMVKHMPDIGQFYRSADVFVFPTFEEGGPQVTNEAAGCGVPVITTPMGAARVANGATGFVLDPLDEAGWIEALRTLAEDVELRRRMGAEACRRAMSVTWGEAGEARGHVFNEITGRLRTKQDSRRHSLANDLEAP
jgi:glycosyltransferase involved in cell wall biosynthesis